RPHSSGNVRRAAVLQGTGKRDRQFCLSPLPVPKPEGRRMPDFDVVKELDPKLRRLVRSRTNPARLVMDRDAAFVTAEAGAHETTPELYYKRVLVQIDAPGPPPGLGARWHQI